MIANIVENPDPTTTQRVATAVVNTGFVSIIKKNFSCPMLARKVGMHIVENSELLSEQTKLVKDAVELPVSVKLSPNFSNIAESAKSEESAGADAISTTN